MPLPFPFPTGDAGAVFAFLECGRVGTGAEWVPEACAAAFVGEKERAEEEAEEEGAEEAERSVGSVARAAARGPRSGASQRAAWRPAL